MTEEMAAAVDGAAVGSRAGVRASAETHGASDTTLLASRIGPVYTVNQVARWLTTPGNSRLSQATVRKRIHAHKLVALRTDDRRWALPAWQFTRTAGQLQPRREVLGLWSMLPHDSWMDAATLAGWMATRLTNLDRLTPADYANRHGANHPEIQAALSRLRDRAV